VSEIPKDMRIVFDGFPRTVVQAGALEDLLKEFGRAIDAVILLDAPREELFTRLAKRAARQKRADDTPEVIGRRLDVYEEQTRPVIEHYESRGKVRRVNGVGGIDEIAARLRKAALE
jgi:adenylate kinase